MVDVKRRRTLILLLIALVTVVLVALAALFYSGGREPEVAEAAVEEAVVLGADGRPVMDMPVDEAGDFAGPEHRSTRLRHQANRTRYAPLAVVPLESGDFDDKLAGAVGREADSLRREARRARDVLRPTITRAQAAGLADALNLALRRMAGLGDDEYLAALPQPVGWTLPGFAEFLAGQTQIDSDLADDPAALFAAASKLYRETNAEWGVLTEAACLSPPGFQIHLAQGIGGHPPIDPSMRMTAAEFEFWQGGLSAGGAIFTTPPSVAGDPSLLRAYVFAVLAGPLDRYPVQLTFAFDPGVGAWRLVGVARSSSVRVGNATMPVF